jgi:protein involved in polysaccharide export with SLBB domain
MSICGRLSAVILACSLFACATPAPRAPTSVPPLPAVSGTAVPQASQFDPLDANFYRLSGGDVLRIDVLGEAELSMETPVDPSGYINYPFLGSVMAGGLTVRALEARIRSGLANGYLVNPDVRVGLKQYRPVFVSGQVRQSGAYPYALGLTVEKAITLAGGLTPYASTSRIYVQRKGMPIESRMRTTLDGAVYPGDTIIVEERLF